MRSLRTVAGYRLLGRDRSVGVRKVLAFIDPLMLEYNISVRCYEQNYKLHPYPRSAS